MPKKPAKVGAKTLTALAKAEQLLKLDATRIQELESALEMVEAEKASLQEELAKQCDALEQANQQILTLRSAADDHNREYADVRQELTDCQSSNDTYLRKDTDQIQQIATLKKAADEQETDLTEARSRASFYRWGFWILLGAFVFVFVCALWMGFHPQPCEAPTIP